VMTSGTRLPSGSTPRTAWAILVRARCYGAWTISLQTR
jgi:hypothetical protein